MQATLRALATALLVLALAACGSPGVKPPPSRPDPAEHAAQLEARGDHAGAARLYEDLARAAYPPERQDYQLRAVAALNRGGQPGRAHALLGMIDTTGLPPEYDTRKRVLAAELYLVSNKPREALRELPTRIPADLPQELAAQVLDTQARAYERTRNHLESVRTRVAADTYIDSPEAMRANHEAIWAALSGLSEIALQRLRTAPPPDVLAGWMELAQSVRSTPPSKAALGRLLDDWRTRYPAHPAERFVIPDLVERQPVVPVSAERIALLLPATGKLARPGQAVRDGFLAAYYADGAEKRPDVRIYDTGANPANAWSIYRQAVSDGAEVVVGPLSKEAVANLAVSGTLDVPILALNYAGDEASPPENFFQFGLLPEDEARQAAERAWMEGHVAALTMVPAGDWGQRMLDAFRERWETFGGEVLAQEAYDAGASDHSNALRRMLGIDASEARRKALNNLLGVSVDFQPRRRQDVDFVFLAGFPRHARLLRPQLRFHHAGDLPVYATSHVYSGQRNAEADRDLDGLAFCDMPWILEDGGEDADPLRAEIAHLWPEDHERHARLHALGADAYDLLDELWRLKSSPYARVDGRSGGLHMDEDGRIHRDLLWARFVGGRPLRIPEIAFPGL